MKADTRNGYIKRYDFAIAQVKQAMTAEDVPADVMEKLQALFNAGRELSPTVYDNENTAFVSNKLQGYENRVLNALGGDFDYTGIPTTLPEVVEKGSILDMIMEAGSLLGFAYAKALDSNKLAAHIPAIVAIKTKMIEIQDLGLSVARIHGLEK